MSREIAARYFAMCKVSEVCTSEIYSAASRVETLIEELTEGKIQSGLEVAKTDEIKDALAQIKRYSEILK